MPKAGNLQRVITKQPAVIPTLGWIKKRLICQGQQKTAGPRIITALHFFNHKPFSESALNFK